MKRFINTLVIIFIALHIQSCVSSPTVSQPVNPPQKNQPPVPIAENRIQVFKDGFVSPFQNWSWGSETSTENGILKVHITDGWGALRPHSGGEAVKNVTKVVFRAKGEGQTINLSFDGDGYFTEVQSITLSSEMKEYSVPHDRTPVVGVAWQDSTGSGLNPFYIEEIYLVTDDSPIVIAPPSGKAAVNLTVNPNEVLGNINPHIYGMSFANPELAKELDLPINRWGGNATTRYNWELSATNKANDWYFLNVPDGPAEGVDENNLPDTATFNSFIQQNLSSQSDTVLTIPMIGWTTNGRNDNCGFDISKYGVQDSTEEPWRPHCGNGFKDGKALLGKSPEDTSIAIDERYTQRWLEYIKQRYGNNSVEYIALDNEPMLWNSTHRDVHPEPVSYDKIRDLTFQYAPAIKAVNPNAKTLGPVVWGWTAYDYSAKDATVESFWNNPPDRNAHGGKAFLPWYLEQMADYEKKNGQRILDYLDIHFYPQQENVAISENVSPATQALRLRSTRTLWDSSYNDESWINETVQLIPRMKQMIATEYPDTKLALTEYNWGATKHINGALAQADALGIFGREGLDMALFWANPESSDAVSYAFRMFRNYDGQGGKFGDVGLKAGSSQQDKVSVYAAKRSDGAVTIILVNKSLKDIEVDLDIEGISSEAEVYQYSKQDITNIEKLSNQSFDKTFVMPKDSIQMLVIKQ